MTIDLHSVERGGKHTLGHDLHFKAARYEADHTVTFKNPNAALLEILRKSGPVPGDGDANGRKKDAERKKKKSGQVDMDKLAEGLVKLTEDDLLQVVQIIHDNKNDDTYTKNDVERKSATTLHVGVSLTSFQKGNSTSICTLYLTVVSRCFGSSCNPRFRLVLRTDQSQQLIEAHDRI